MPMAGGSLEKRELKSFNAPQKTEGKFPQAMGEMVDATAGKITPRMREFSRVQFRRDNLSSLYERG
jgi:hypothetical protein